jgi:hypothetical protein
MFCSCHLKDIELKIELFGYIKWDDDTSGKITHQQMEMERLIVQIETGKVNSKYGTKDCRKFSQHSFYTEEWAVKVDDHENEFKTKIKVFVCPAAGEQQKEHSYFRSLIIFDSTVS